MVRKADRIVIIGNGKLAGAIEKDFHRYSGIPVEKYSEQTGASEKTVFLHIGSGRQYGEALDKAREKGAPFIQAATEKDIPMAVPEEGDVPYISAPNLDLNMVRFFRLLRLSGSLFGEEEIVITESHQKEKTSRAGTAEKIAGYLNRPGESVISIRDRESQTGLGIRNLSHHAYHEVRIGNGDSTLTFTAKIEGAEGYLKGLARIAEAAVSLEKRNYQIEELIGRGL